jgi:hypothetical protein
VRECGARNAEKRGSKERCGRAFRVLARSLLTAHSTGCALAGKQWLSGAVTEQGIERGATWLTWTKPTTERPCTREV